MGRQPISLERTMTLRSERTRFSRVVRLIIFGIFLSVIFQLTRFSSTNRSLSKELLRSNAIHTHFLVSHSCNIGHQTVHFPTFPTFIIVGAQKAGTTAISEILDKVPGLLRTREVEPHFWDRDVPSDYEALSSNQRCQLLLCYFKNWIRPGIRSDMITFEKTPILMALENVPEKINLLLPHKPKIIMILRDPVNRLFSEYKMNWQAEEDNKKSNNNNRHRNRNKIIPSRHKTIFLPDNFDGISSTRTNNSKPETKTYKNFTSFDDWVKNGVENLIAKEAIKAPRYSNANTDWNQTDFGIGRPLLGSHALEAFSGIARGFYAQQIKRYMKFFPIDETLKVIRFEDFQKNKIAVLQEILEFVGSSYYKFDDAHINRQLGPTEVLYRYPDLNNATKIYLKHLYKPFNDDLADLLGESWRGVWD